MCVLLWGQLYAIFARNRFITLIIIRGCTCTYKVMITPVVYVDFLLQKTDLKSFLPPALLDGCGLSFASVVLYSLLNPSQHTQVHSTDVNDLLL